MILPQAMRRSIPGLVNEFVYLIKYSSLAYMITVIELTGAGKQVATRYFTYNETFFVIGLVYLALVTVTTIGAHLLEKRVAVPTSGSGLRPGPRPRARPSRPRPRRPGPRAG